MEHPYEIVRYKNDMNKGVIAMKFGCTLPDTNRSLKNLVSKGMV